MPKSGLVAARMHRGPPPTGKPGNQGYCRPNAGLYETTAVSGLIRTSLSLEQVSDRTCGRCSGAASAPIGIAGTMAPSRSPFRLLVGGGSTLLAGRHTPGRTGIPSGLLRESLMPASRWETGGFTATMARWFIWFGRAYKV